MFKAFFLLPLTSKNIRYCRFTGDTLFYNLNSTFFFILDFFYLTERTLVQEFHCLTWISLVPAQIVINLSWTLNFSNVQHSPAVLTELNKTLNSSMNPLTALIFSLHSDVVTHIVSEDSQASSLWTWLKGCDLRNLTSMLVLDISWFTDSMREGRPVAVETRHLIQVCVCFTNQTEMSRQM